MRWNKTPFQFVASMSDGDATVEGKETLRSTRRNPIDKSHTRDEKYETERYIKLYLYISTVNDSNNPSAFVAQSKENALLYRLTKRGSMKR